MATSAIAFMIVLDIEFGTTVPSIRNILCFFYTDGETFFQVREWLTIDLKCWGRGGVEAEESLLI